MIEEINLIDIDEKLLNTADQVLVLISSESSGSSFLMERTLNNIISTSKENIKIYKLMVEKNERILKIFVQSKNDIPSILMFNRGELWKIISGLVGIEELNKKIESKVEYVN
jgi:thioredoxin-like negative regulator of GroEL